MDNAVFKVQAYFSEGTSFQVEYKNKRYTITAGHVCGGFEYMAVNGSNKKVLYYDPSTDVCILEPFGEEYLTLLNKSYKGEVFALVYRDEVKYMISGFPQHNISQNNLRATIASFKVIQGNSGGPVVNRWGNVTGLISMFYQQELPLGLFIPVEDIIYTLDKLGKYEQRKFN